VTRAPLPRFLLDGMLGTLARRLRLLGLDAAFLPDAPDGAVAGAALAQARVLLTRDRRLAARLPGRALLVTGDGLEEEFSCLVPFLAPHRESLRPFTRCLACNGELLPLGWEEAQGLVPGFVHLTAPKFARCEGCGRVFWEGTHSARMRRTVGGLMEKLGGG